MAEEKRVNSFAPNPDEEDDKGDLPSLDEFSVKTDKPVAPAKADIDQLAESTGFPSRKQVVAKKTGTIERKMGPRRRTNKTEPLSLKVSTDAMNRFYALVDQLDETLGDTFEMAVTALEKELEKSKKK